MRLQNIKKYIAIIFAAFMCDVGCASALGYKPRVDPIKTVKSGMKLGWLRRQFNSSKTNPSKTIVSKGISASSPRWTIEYDKKFTDASKKKQKVEDSISILTDTDSSRQGYTLSRWLVLTGTVLGNLADLYNNYTPPVVIDVNESSAILSDTVFRYVFDVYLNNRAIGAYFILNQYMLGNADSSINDNNVLQQKFMNAEKTQDIYSNKDDASAHEMNLDNGKLKSPDGDAEIELNDDVKAKLVEIAKSPQKGSVVVEKVISHGLYNYKYRFVISWGKYAIQNSYGPGFTEQNAFFVSTSYTLISTNILSQDQVGEQTLSFVQPLPAENPPSFDLKDDYLYKS